MANFIGEHTCKLDGKGRVLLPSSLKKQVTAGEDRFVVKKSIFGNCLELFPMEEWTRIVQQLRKNTNPYNREHVKFVREFFKGAAELALDGSGRLLFPKRLIEEISADKEVIMAGQFEKIEIWSKAEYHKMSVDEDGFADLAEKILGGTNLSEEE